MNIPTAEEFLNSKPFMRSDLKCETNYELMREFARLHVEAALKAASENAICDSFYEEWDGDKLVLNMDVNYLASYKFPVLISCKSYDLDRDSILDAYPLTNIK